MSRRTRLVAATILVIAVLVVADALLWRWVSQELQSGFAAWAAAERAEGYTVTSGAARTSGWPFAAELSVSDVSLRGPLGDLPIDAAWTAPRSGRSGSRRPGRAGCWRGLASCAEFAGRSVAATTCRRTVRC